MPLEAEASAESKAEVGVSSMSGNAMVTQCARVDLRARHRARQVLAVIASCLGDSQRLGTPELELGDRGRMAPVLGRTQQRVAQRVRRVAPPFADAPVAKRHPTFLADEVSEMSSASRTRAQEWSNYR